MAAVAGLYLKAPALRELIDEFGALSAVLTVPSARLAGLSPAAGEAAQKLRRSVARHEAAAARRVGQALGAGLQVLTWESELYPPPLHHDPVGCAPVLFVEGALPPQLRYGSHEARSCAVVGTRRASPGGKGFTRDLARALSREGILVVSGLALGIDGAAHEGALEAVELGAAGVSVPTPHADRLPVALRRYRWRGDAEPAPRPAGTIAVLGGGHGHLHPAEHRGLARRILAAGGAILSEWPPDMAAQKFTFLQRNRVISGLSRVVAVIEAGPRSGTNSTARHALDQGRTVMAVPAAPWDLSGASCLDLLRTGAEPLFDVENVFQQFVNLVERPRSELAAEQARLAFVEPDPAERVAAELALAMQGAMQGGHAVALDTLVAATGLGPGELMARLSELELAGVVERVEGGRFRWRAGGWRA